ncbi:DUF2142 domain-containing protein [Labrys wisconsinensis]|uniref:DUF2142 domain-containing protein n=1 Tax=Labrys wisconsinensis TaxID=425677 RepID=A0ABU0J3D9_9HYPH|nr:DUF2142 domain-containing protein [Labrys wisconsinensis]MDQ0468786.1 hypothetical protein [Labrys wisconsinensis]
MLQRLLTRPDRLFLVLATLFGLVFVAAIPPLGGGNETFNFQRAAAIAAGHPLIEPAAVRPGIVDLIDAGWAAFPSGSQPPYGYSLDTWRRAAAIPLDGPEKTLQPNPIAVLHPLSYTPQVPLLWLGGALGLPPLVLFYLGRLGGLIAGIGLTALAIRTMPSHRFALCALALLPTVTFTRSTLDADQLTTGLAFLLAAMILAETVRRDAIGTGALLRLAAAAFVLAQCKTAYLVLPLLAFAIPRARFASTRAYAGAMALIVLPGALASFAWMLALKLTYFSGIEYRTWAGLVQPDRQVALILSDPLGYAAVLGRTLVQTPLLYDSVTGFLGVFGPPVSFPAPAYAVLFALLLFVLVSDPTSRAADYARTVRWLAVAIFVAGIVLILTLLYIQWTGYGSPTIQGFQGRYLYPLAPLPLILLRTSGGPLLGLSAGAWTALLAMVGFAGALWISLETYYG